MLKYEYCREKKMGVKRIVDQDLSEKRKKRKKKFLHPQFIADAIHKKMGVGQIVDQNSDKKKMGVRY